MDFDVILVGGGTAGCVLANRLTESPVNRVLLLEAGGLYSKIRLGVPLASMREMTRFSWKYFTGQQVHLNHRKISWPFGKVLGGSSSINAMMYNRGNRNNYDEWQEIGGKGWSFAEVLPYFKKSENQERGASEYHGVGGPIDVSNARHKAAFSSAFVEACEQAGIKTNDDFNGNRQSGAGFFQLTQKRGQRVSTASAYLHPALHRSNLKVLTRAHVHRILFSGNCAKGIEYSVNGSVSRAWAEKEVILCAGAINSPQILMLSGIGPGDHLSSLGIRVIVDLPGVGKNLQDHVRVPLLYHSDRISPGAMRYWLPIAVQYGLFRRGVLTSNCCESGAFLKLDDTEDAMNIQYVTHFQSAIYEGSVDFETCLIAPKSRGQIMLLSSDPLSAPLIDPNYLSDSSDLESLVSGLKLARRIARQRVFKDFKLGKEILPGSDIRKDKDIGSYVRTSLETNYHPVGTCKMGSDAMAVVDSSLNVRGTENLRVVDASIMPKIINGNTCAPTIMIGEKAADLIKGSLK